MSKKMKKHFLMEERNIEFLERYKEEKHLRSVSAALDSILQQYIEGQSKEKEREDFISAISQRIREDNKNLETRLRLGVRSADINSQVMIEILNTMLLQMNIDQFIDTDFLRAEPLKAAQETVKKRIELYKQRRDDASY